MRVIVGAHGDCTATHGAQDPRPWRAWRLRGGLVAQGHQPPWQCSIDGWSEVPVSVAGSKVVNFDAGRVRSRTGPLAVNVRTPVACKARSVDWSEWFAPGVWPGGLATSNEALEHTNDGTIGWIVADAGDTTINANVAAAAARASLIVNPLGGIRVLVEYLTATHHLQAAWRGRACSGFVLDFTSSTPTVARHQVGRPSRAGERGEPRAGGRSRAMSLPSAYRRLARYKEDPFEN
jgi:hypothetical protein